MTSLQRLRFVVIVLPVRFRLSLELQDFQGSIRALGTSFDAAGRFPEKSLQLFNRV
jgi:hypothetical protein